MKETKDETPVKEETPEIVTPKLSIVIPYLKSKAQGDELLYALRSIAKNLREVCQVIIIGDREPWFSDQVLVIDSPVVSDNPQIDTLNKLKEAIASELVSDKFIWSNDDVYFNSPVMAYDIQILVAEGKLIPISDSKSIYDINRNKTIDILKKMEVTSKVNFPMDNYDVHIPFFYEKEKLVELFEEIPELNTEGLLIPSLYLNLIFGDHIPMQVDGIRGEYLLRINSKNPDLSTFNKFVANKKFLNNSENGYNDVLVNYLKTKFPDKSAFEL